MKNIQKHTNAPRHDRHSKWIFIVPSAILFALLAIPLAAVIVRSVSPEFFNNAFSRQATKALSLSLVTSTMTMIVAALFGTPLAYILARWKFKYKSWIELILDLPIVLPPSIAGLALLIAFGRNGYFGPALNFLGISLPFTTAAVVIAQTFVAAPLYIRSARIGFSEIDQQLIEAAHVEGASQWQLFKEVMIPLTGRCPCQRSHPYVDAGAGRIRRDDPVRREPGGHHTDDAHGDLCRIRTKPRCGIGAVRCFNIRVGRCADGYKEIGKARMIPNHHH